jgi:hypothetical protein
MIYKYSTSVTLSKFLLLRDDMVVRLGCCGRKVFHRVLFFFCKVDFFFPLNTLKNFKHQ